MTTCQPGQVPLGYVPPLSGVRIVDFSQIGAGPYGTSMLGDMGADVIKIEPPDGESFRYIDNIFDTGDSAYFYGVNRSKRSLTLDLRHPDAADVIRHLAEQADAVVVAFRPDAVERLGIGYERLSAYNDQLIYCQITAFGEAGPRAHQPGMDILGQAIGGIMGMTGERDGPPIKAGVPMADFAVSFLLGFAVCAALRGRELNGRGQKISLNLLDGQVAMLANILTHYQHTQVPVRPAGGGHPQIAPYQPFRGSEGEYFILACLTDRFWVRLADVLERPELATDPRFATNPDRVRNRKELTAMLDEIFRKHPSEYWLRKFDAAGVPSGPINRLEAVFDEPQVRHNESIISLVHPVHGEYPVPNNPIRMHGTPARPRGYAPQLGEHSREVLAEFGLTDEEIDRLVKSGTVSVFER